MRKVATVFGGTGFIGKALIWRLVKAGWTVKVPTRNPKQVSPLLAMGTPGQVVLLPWGLGQTARTIALVKGSDLVVNLLGILAQDRRNTFKTVQTDMAAEIAMAAHDEGVAHLVHISAIGASADSASEYARTKAAGEAAVLKAFPTATILRPSLVVGEGDGFFGRFSAMSTLSPFLPLVGGGVTKFQPVFVGDVADAVLAAVARKDAQGKVFELGGPEVLSFKALLQLMLKEMGRCRILLHMPWSLANLLALLTAWLPKAPLTLDQIKLLEHDNVVSAGALGLKELGITPTPLKAFLPSYLGLYRHRS